MISSPQPWFCCTDWHLIGRKHESRWRRLTMEDLFVIADENGFLLSRVSPDAAWRAVGWPTKNISITANPRRS